MKGKYELAQMSVWKKKKVQRYQDAEDECYGFINEYPDSKGTFDCRKVYREVQAIYCKSKIEI